MVVESFFAESFFKWCFRSTKISFAFIFWFIGNICLMHNIWCKTYMVQGTFIFISLQLHSKYLLLGFKTCSFSDNITDPMLFTKQWLILTFLQLNVLRIGWCFGKWCCKSCRKVLPSLVFKLLQKGCLNHIMYNKVVLFVFILP